MKKLFFAIAAVMSLGLGIGANAVDDAVKVRLDGEYIDFDVQPRIVNDRTMVPLRAIFEAIGAEVDWDGKTQTVTSSMEGIDISLKIGSDVMYVNNEPVELDSPAYIENDRTMVPLRAISESYNINVDWRENTRLVSLASVNIGVAQNYADDNVRCINHMGYHVSAPANSLEAFKLSRKMGYSYVETDIRFTHDNIPVLTHEFLLENIARNADGTPIEKSHNIGNLTYEELEKYDFGIASGVEWKGVKLAKFEDFIKLCDDLNLYAYLDLKDNYDDEKLDILLGIVKKYDMMDRVVWCKYYKGILTKEPVANIGYTCGDLDYSFLDEVADLSDNGASVHVLSEINNNEFREFYLDEFGKYGDIVAWTVNDKEAANKMIKTGKVKGIITDTLNVAELNKELEKAQK